MIDMMLQKLSMLLFQIDWTTVTVTFSLASLVCEQVTANSELCCEAFNLNKEEGEHQSSLGLISLVTSGV